MANKQVFLRQRYKVWIRYVTVRVKTSLVHTSKFAALEVHNFPYERHTEIKFTGLVELTSLYNC